jgi:RHS repeat-associated protein
MFLLSLSRATLLRVALLPVLSLSGSARAADVVEYVVTDALGNIRAIEDEQGNVIERHDYLPFGEECTTGPCAASLSLLSEQPRRFTGKERDAETGLDYFGARYYSAPVGRFTTVDPVGDRLAFTDPQRWNRYTYAFDQLRGTNDVQEVKPGVLVAKGATGGNVTFRAQSKSGPATVDVHGVEGGVRKIKFVSE